MAWSISSRLQGPAAAMTLSRSVMTVLQNYRTSEYINGWNAVLYNNVQRYLHILTCFFFPPDLPARPNFTPDSGSKWASLGAWLPLFGMTGVIGWLQMRRKHWLKKFLWILFLMALVPFLNASFQMMNSAFYARWYYMLTLMMAMATVLALVAALAGHQMNRFLWLWSALLSATVPLSLPLSGTLPLSLLCRRLHKSGCAVAGWKGARAISAARRVVVTDEDLFPAGVLSLQKKGKEGPASAPVGTVELNGLKVYGEEINQALAYAEALCRAAGSQLTPLFQQLMDGQVSFRYDAHDLHYYEDGGVDCTIRGATVAMGSAYFMKKRRITLPHDLKMDTGVFMSVDGRLAAIFVVKYLPSRNVEWALRALRRNRVTPVLATRGVNITPNMLKRKFRLNARPIYPGVATRLALADLTGQRGEAPNAIIYRDGLLPMAETVIGSQRMCQAVRWSTALGWIGGLCGLVLSYYLTTAGDFAALSPLYMLAFLALLLLPTLLLSGLVKYY